ncbi:MAG: hypothetical protein K6G85_05200 [Eubacterium sp.]|nr:hypothetical protein [Eubacterium sp.]
MGKIEPKQVRETQSLFEKKDYHDSYYMLFGLKGEPSVLDLAGTKKYLMALLGDEKNSLKQVREGRKIAKYIEQFYRPNKVNTRYCDFCGVELSGVEYDTLMDGRDRCVTCSRTAVKSEAEFKKIFQDVRRNMESAFGIKLMAGVRVQMVNSKRLYRAMGRNFTPREKESGRAVGVAIRKADHFELLIENGSPRIKAIMTMAHELTHIWQYINWNSKQIRRTYGKELELQIYEGMAKWVEIQYAYLINEHAIAKREEIITAYRQDEYGFGFLRYRSNYAFSLENVITGDTPFTDKNYPLGLDYLGEVSIPIEFLEVPEYYEEDDELTEEEKTQLREEFERDSGGKNRDSNQLYYFFYEQLDEEEQQLYMQVLAAIQEMKTEILLEQTVKNGVLKKIQTAVLHDHPELFWFQNGMLFYGGSEEEATKCGFTYCMEREERERRQEMINTAVEEVFLKNVSEQMSDYEAVLQIYENIIDLVDYDSIGLDEQKAKGRMSVEEYDNLRSIYGTLVNKKAVCAGYAKAFQYLLQKIGVECLYVIGPTGKEWHAWNIVRIEDEYYYMDVTWGDYSNTKEEKNISDDIKYFYFGITTEELMLDHTPCVEGFEMPVCTATACNYFVRSGLYFDTYNLKEMKERALRAVIAKEKSICFKFKNEQVCNEIKDKLIRGNGWGEIQQYINLKMGKTIDSSSITYIDGKKNKALLEFIFKYI